MSVTTTTICGSCEREWPTDGGPICPSCGNDGSIEPHAVREQPRVKLTGRDGNAFAVMGACVTAARRAGWSDDQITAVVDEMQAGDYDHLLATALRHFDVH